VSIAVLMASRIVVVVALSAVLAGCPLFHDHEGRTQRDAEARYAKIARQLARLSPQFPHLSALLSARWAKARAAYAKAKASAEKKGRGDAMMAALKPVTGPLDSLLECARYLGKLGPLLEAAPTKRAAAARVKLAQLRQKLDDKAISDAALVARVRELSGKIGTIYYRLRRELEQGKKRTNK
jgi:hypothetical protein